MARPIWKGHVSFGLVSVPVVLHSGEQRADISFHLIDSRNSARIRYERINEETGEEVPWDKIVKGYEYGDNNYVLLSEGEFERASVEMTRSIDIEEFVDVSEIDIRYFDKPYILVPDKKGEKGYVLLREAISKSGKAGIARVVIRARQHLAALMARGDALMLELLRFDQELRSLSEFDLPGHDLRKYKVSKQETDLATQLVEGMSGDWDASAFHDEYRDALMKLVKSKIKRGETEAIEVEEEEEEDQSPQTLNFMDVLKESVSHTSKRRGTQKSAVRKAPASKARGKSAAAKKTAPRRAKKKRAG
jgi:DNA end-binding protein Ku